MWKLVFFFWVANNSNSMEQYWRFFLMLERPRSRVEPGMAVTFFHITTEKIPLAITGIYNESMNTFSHSLRPIPKPETCDGKY